jgi:hypothetical protein
MEQAFQPAETGRLKVRPAPSKSNETHPIYFGAAGCKAVVQRNVSIILLNCNHKTYAKPFRVLNFYLRLFHNSNNCTSKKQLSER